MDRADGCPAMTNERKKVKLELIMDTPKYILY